MRCIRCNRPLLQYAVSVPTANGLHGWGPKCAKQEGVQPAGPVKVRRTVKVQRVDDERQDDWIVVAENAQYANSAAICEASI